MIVFHAGFLDDRLCLWGETPISDSPYSSPGNKRTASNARRRIPKPLPYDAGTAGLSAALGGIVSGLRKHESDPEISAIWLPTINNQPVASSPMIAEPPPSSARASLESWAVTVFPLSTAEAIELLCACLGRETLVPGVIIGRDLTYWVSAMRFASALVAREHFLPGLKANGKSFRANWEPVFSGADAQRLTRLARAMPGACRALSAIDDTAPADRPALSVLSSFLNSVVEFMVRSRLEQSRPVMLRTKSKYASFESIHDQWLHALREGNGQMDCEASDLANLSEQLREWRRPILISASTPFRLCFRLEEPEERVGERESGRAGEREDSTPISRLSTPPISPSPTLPLSHSASPWRVRYLLQGADDPSLLISVADAWSGKGRGAAALKRSAFNLREYLLSSLGHAAALSPEIEISLKSAAPGGYDLDSTGAHKFLVEKAWLLEQAGFGVMLPSWWTRKGTKTRLTMRANVRSPKMQSKSGLSLDQIVRFDWEIALGDQLLSFEELLALAKLKSPLIKMRGRWVELNADEIQAALDFWKKKSTGQTTFREVVQMALGRAGTPGGIDFVGVSASGWIDNFLAQLEGRKEFEELAVPEEIQGTLRPYQVRGFSWLSFLRQWGLGACLADDMGLGKTIQTLTLIQHEWQGNDRRPYLIVCPTSVIGNWQKEAARFTPDLPILVHHGLTRAKGESFIKKAARHAIVISSYSLLQRDFEILKEIPWTGVILDEAQNIKNPETKQAKAARSLKSDCRIALTGTPVENNVGDLWAIMEFLNPGFLGSQTEFKRSFFVPIQAQHDEEAAKSLKHMTGPFILRRLKTDKQIIADLPEKNEMKVYCTLTREQASLYAAVVEDATGEIEESSGIQRRGIVLATLAKLKQVCNHPAQFLGDNSAIPGRSGKLSRLVEMLEEALAAGDRALIFTQFAEMGTIIQRHLQETFGREALFLYGAVTKKKRDLMVERFQSANGDGPRIFVLSLKAGGTGLNLTAANHVFHFDRWWNPAVENQATDRAFRIGQTRNVQVHKFLCAGTLEEKIDEMIERKKDIASSIVGAGENWLTELSTAQLKDLFALREDAVGE
ncbi:MAG: DEAD/DEAH box helicase [Acidobacteria bacterium]|nr:DEAD/DEAH box helicase [Acidobacteriota bacterium]